MKKLTCISIFVFIQVFCFSQNRVFTTKNFNNIGAVKSNLPLFFNLQSSHNETPSFVFLKPGQSYRKPMFCRMEDKLYKRCNVWILFRAGSDESYRQLIKICE